MKRQHRVGSKMGELHIAPHKEGHKEKILGGLEKLKVGGTQEEIATACSLRPDQVWKRLSELADEKQDGGAKIFDTGLMRPLKSGIPGIVWQLKNLPQSRTEYANEVISLASKPTAVQTDLFK